MLNRLVKLKLCYCNYINSTTNVSKSHGGWCHVITTGIQNVHQVHLLWHTWWHVRYVQKSQTTPYIDYIADMSIDFNLNDMIHYYLPLPNFHRCRKELYLKTCEAYVQQLPLCFFKYLPTINITSPKIHASMTLHEKFWCEGNNNGKLGRNYTYWTYI